MLGTVRFSILSIFALFTLVLAGWAAELTVHSNEELTRAAHVAKPGDVIILEDGEFSGVQLVGLIGTEESPITIRGRSAEQPARFRGGNTGLQLSGAKNVTLRYLDVRGASLNGINIDDGRDKANPATGIVVDQCHFADIGPRGNHDGLKLSGLDQFVVTQCSFAGWGGSAIDMVGCHDGVVRNCTFTGKEGFSQSNAIQMKGGSARVRVISNAFRDAGERSINIGGSTGLEFFRPRVDDFEALDIEVAGNTFVGSMAPIAWVTSAVGHVHHNTIIRPGKWVARILQENTASQFKPAHDGVFEYNLVVFDDNVRTFVNVGGGTASETFTFRRNAWFETGAVSNQRRPSLPTDEIEGIYGIDPEITSADDGDPIATSENPALRGIGADAYPSSDDAVPVAR